MLAPAARVKAIVRSVCPRSILMWREEKYFEKFGELEIHFVPHLCRPDGDALDIGANEGAYLHAMTRYARHVYAFEPVPWLAERIRGKFRNRITVNSFALSDVEGTSYLKIPKIDGQLMTGLSSLGAPASGSEFHHIPVKTMPLDSVYPRSDRAGFLKIDVEGHEEAVLQGAQKTITRCRPRVQVEIVEDLSPGGLGRISEFFSELGYQGFFAYGRSLMRVSQFVARTMQRAELITGYGAMVAHDLAGKYVANFIFVPNEDADVVAPQLERALIGTTSKPTLEEAAAFA